MHMIASFELVFFWYSFELLFWSFYLNNKDKCVVQRIKQKMEVSNTNLIRGFLTHYCNYIKSS